MTARSTFWARRLAGVRQEAEAEAAAAAAPAPQDEAPRTDAEILQDLNLPDPETLGLGDDFKGFMAQAVPRHIRNRALRQLWRSNPVLACLDGLNDYDDDYLTGSTGNAPIKTSYMVGKGMLAHVQEMDRQQALTAKVPEPDVALDDNGPATDAIDAADQPDRAETVPETLAEPAPETVPETEIASASADIQQDDAEPPAAPAPRRMRFEFAGDSA